MNKYINIKIYLLLSSIFCTILVTGNLIFQKFISLNLSNLLLFEISVGVLLYPITFIITDLITEFFGKQWANYAVRVGIICDIIIMGLVYISNNLPATSWSPVNDKIFSHVFSIYGIASIASLFACFIAQCTDITIFAWIKKLTGKRMMWLRCNVSTIAAQLIDTISVNGLLCIFGIIPTDKLIMITLNSFLFKLLAAVLLSTPIFYLCYFAINKLLTKTHKDKFSIEVL